MSCPGCKPASSHGLTVPNRIQYWNRIHTAAVCDWQAGGERFRTLRMAPPETSDCYGETMIRSDWPCSTAHCCSTVLTSTGNRCVAVERSICCLTDSIARHLAANWTVSLTNCIAVSKSQTRYDNNSLFTVPWTKSAARPTECFGAKCINISRSW
jgi:hypothetical protein